MKDILPCSTKQWRHMVNQIYEIILARGYHEIIMHCMEHKEVFAALGQTSDIVSKEMYYLTDSELVLRPEGTASFMRAVLEHNLLDKQCGLFYFGPMFRKERPQQGRWREFYQVGIEHLAVQPCNNIGQELEILVTSYKLFNALGLIDKVQLHINNLGTVSERISYKENLVKYFQNHLNDLSPSQVDTLQKNPLRLLDSKEPNLKDLVSQSPSIDKYTDNTEFQALIQQLIIHIPEDKITIDTKLVRGLDYYTGTVFEWKLANAGSQDTLCAGGRYDLLFVNNHHLGTVSAFGCGIGVDRMFFYLNDNKFEQNSNEDIYVAGLDAFSLVENLRTLGYKVIYSTLLRSVNFHKAQSYQCQIFIYQDKNQYLIHKQADSYIAISLEEVLIKVAELISFN